MWTVENSKPLGNSSSRLFNYLLNFEDWKILLSSKIHSHSKKKTYAFYISTGMYKHWVFIRSAFSKKILFGQIVLWILSTAVHRQVSLYIVGRDTHTQKGMVDMHAISLYVLPLTWWGPKLYLLSRGYIVYKQDEQEQSNQWIWWRAEDLPLFGRE